MEARGIHHVGVAVADLDQAVRTYEQVLGARLERRERVEEQGVEAASMQVGESRVELLAALGDDTPVGRFLARRGPGMHHVAYEVDDLEDGPRVVVLETEDGPYHVVVQRVSYFRRFNRAGRVGFAAG